MQKILMGTVPIVAQSLMKAEAWSNLASSHFNLDWFVAVV